MILFNRCLSDKVEFYYISMSGYRTTTRSSHLELFVTYVSLTFLNSLVGTCFFVSRFASTRSTHTTHHGDDDGLSSTTVTTGTNFLQRYLVPLYLSDFLIVVVVAVVAARLWLDHHNHQVS
jgi:hypothetical protein